MATMRTKALLIGIQYSESCWETLDGPHHDIHKMKKFLEDGPWQYGQIRVLVDKDGFMRPTRQGIIDSLLWLCEGATEDHRLFLHYSGHGEQSPTSSASELDGFDENIVPVDCPPGETEDGYRGMIRDNELREILVDGLPIGCHLTALFDCCHSGSILDLRFCYPRYLSIPWTWRNAGPALDAPRLNRTPSDKTNKRNTVPSTFKEALLPDIDTLKSPLTTPDLVTPTPFNPYGLPPEDTPHNKLLSRLRMSVDFVRKTSLREERLAALNSPLGSHFASPIKGLEPTLGLGLTLVATVAKASLSLSPNAIDMWRHNISPFLDDNFLCESPILSSPTATVSVASMKTTLLGGKTSFFQGLVNRAHRTDMQRTCYENEDIPSPFQIIQYDKPIKSRGTWAGFHSDPAPDKPIARVSSFSACYDNQVVFEMGNGDGLLTAAFIHCMQEARYEITYGQLLHKMKQFFVKKNEARSSEKFEEPPFPMLSSSYPMSLESAVEI